MVQVVALDKSFEGVARASERYYNTASLPELEKIRRDLFEPSKTLAQRREASGKHKKTIAALRPIFKEIILERNKMAVKKGYQNYFEFITDFDGISSERIELFLKKVDKLIERLNSKLPRSKSVWYWSKYSLPDALAFDLSKPLDEKEYSVEALCRKIKERKLKIAKVIPRMEIKELKFSPTSPGRYPRVRFNWEEKSVTIYVHLKKVSIYTVLTFLHELGHAASYLELLDQNRRPDAKLRYWCEREAIKIQLRLQGILLPPKIKKVIEVGYLRVVCSALFEHEIYTHPDEDFDKLYAEVANRCFLKAHQVRNPLYAINYYLVNRPGSAVSTSVALIELKTNGEILKTN